MDIIDIVIIGAGASGLVSAINSKTKNNKVVIIERFNKSAKKILVTGNGKCNYWNEDFSNNHFYSNNMDFILQFNRIENRLMTLDFLSSLGIYPSIKNGYFYPMSKEASSIRNLLLNKCQKEGIKIINEINVIDVKKKDNLFYIYYDNGYFVSRKLIIATGSNSYYKEETSGYDICKKLGHTIIKPLPSLVQLITKDKNLNEASGVRNNSKVSLYVNNKLVKEEIGELQLTDYGLSGICIFNLSGYANRALDQNKKVEIKINFLEEIDDLEYFFDQRNDYLKDVKLEDFLEGLLNHKLIKVILKKTKLENKMYSSLTIKERKNLIDTITDYKVVVTGSKDFNDSQVTTGGVNTKEINPKTFESLICKNLYIIGEVLDVDGECGGYNLGFAWLSGVVSGKSAQND